MKAIKPGTERDATPEEIEEYSKFVVHRPTVFSVIMAPLRRRQARRRKWFTATGDAVFASRTTGLTLELDRQPRDQASTRQTVGVLIAGSRLSTGQSHFARLEELEPQP